MDFTGFFSLKNLIYYRLIGHFCLNSNPHTFESTLKNRLFAFLTARNGEEKRDNDDTLWFHKLLLALLPVDILIVSSFLISSDPATSNSSQPHQLEQNKMPMYQFEVPSVFGWRPCNPPTGRNPENPIHDIRKVERVHRMEKKKRQKRLVAFTLELDFRKPEIFRGTKGHWIDLRRLNKNALDADPLKIMFFLSSVTKNNGFQKQTQILSLDFAVAATSSRFCLAKANKRCFFSCKHFPVHFQPLKFELEYWINHDFQVLSLHQYHGITSHFMSFHLPKNIPALKRSPTAVIPIATQKSPRNRLAPRRSRWIFPCLIRRLRGRFSGAWEEDFPRSFQNGRGPDFPEIGFKKIQDIYENLFASRYVCIHFQMIRLRTSHLFLPLLPAPQQQIAGVCLGNEASWWEGVATIDDGVPNLLFSSFQSQAVFFELATVDSCTPAKKKMGNGPVIVDKWKRKNPLQSMTLMTLWVPVPASSFPGCLQLHMLESCSFKLLYINWFSWFPWPFHLNLSTPCSSSILKCSYLLPEKHCIHFSNFNFLWINARKTTLQNRGWRFAHLEKAFQASFSCSGSGSSPCLGNTQIQKWFLQVIQVLNLLGINEKIHEFHQISREVLWISPISPPCFLEASFFKNWYKSWLLWWCDQLNTSCGFGLVVWVFLITLYFDQRKPQKKLINLNLKNHQWK